MGTLKIHRTRFTEEELEIRDEAGNVTDLAGIPYDDDHTETETHEGIGAAEAARLIEEAGCTFAATGNDWAADPDGSYIENYATGMRVETTAHLDGFHPRVLDAIIRKVG